MYEIGYIPEGWVRGQRLVVKPGPKWGVIQRDPAYTDIENVSGEYSLHYHVHAIDHVNEWIKWWYAIEQMGT